MFKKFAIAFLLIAGCLHRGHAQDYRKEQYRPQIHFSPKTGWMNDPNGMVYHQGLYHMFYQYYPNATVWGPMHWGHATSRDLVRWQHQPVALYPDSLGYIFSGSAVVDAANSSGLGKDGKAPLVAIYTYHDTIGEKSGKKDFQTQGIAYSNDEGKTWTKYQGNPVLRNPGIIDFRDPKVMWYAPEKKWVMTLATRDRITFYSSPNLKEWKRESEFGAALGAHGGVWECPDLFQLEQAGKKHWVLIVNLNPGGPNGGSATQYFIGDFNGQSFIPADTATRWLDYGPDEYAGITYANTGNRKIFIGWMSNWHYAQQVPTGKWRSALTIPRDLSLAAAGGKLYVASRPSQELSTLEKQVTSLGPVKAGPNAFIKNFSLPARLELEAAALQDFQLVLSNDAGEELVVGFDKAANQYFVDRTQSGKIDFNTAFAARHTAPRFVTGSHTDLTLVMDHASLELFADGGLSVMTSIFFPSRPYNKVVLKGNTVFRQVRYRPLVAAF